MKRMMLLCFLTLAIGACDSGDDTNKDPDAGADATTKEKDATAGEDSKPDAIEPDVTIKPDTSTEPDIGVGPQVTSSHTGWMNPDCAGCHDGTTANNPHGSDYEVPKCVECHGYNGAPHTGHASSGNCGNCHSTHGSLGFSNADCTTCHFHP